MSSLTMENKLFLYFQKQLGNWSVLVLFLWGNSDVYKIIPYLLMNGHIPSFVSFSVFRHRYRTWGTGPCKYLTPFRDNTSYSLRHLCQRNIYKARHPCYRRTSLTVSKFMVSPIALKEIILMPYDLSIRGQHYVKE